MKHIVAFLLITTAFCVRSHAGQINYYNQTWAEIKAKAQAEHKYIFMDCYTEWCGWCKVMDKETMTDDGIAGMMNDKFIPVKMDMEKGEGLVLAMKYQVNAYPTFLIFSPDGKLVYETMGYEKTPEFKKTLAAALDKTKQMTAPGYSAGLDVPYPDFYKNSYGGNGKRVFPKPEEVVAYLDGQKDLFTEANWAVIAKFQLNDHYNQYFFDNIKKYKSLYGDMAVKNKVEEIIGMKIQKAIKDKSEAELNEAIAIADKHPSADNKNEKDYLRISYYQQTGDWKKCAATLDNLMKQKGFSDYSTVNSVSWNVYEKCDDKALIKKAAGWMKTATAKQPDYALLDTYASVLYKAGDKKNATIWAKKAIATGKSAGEDVSSTEKLLDKINGQ